MSYYAYDSGGYLGDVASIDGWREFTKWAEQQGGEVAELATSGASDDPDALVSQLAALTATGDVESVRSNLADLVASATDTVIISDGVDGAEVEPVNAKADGARAFGHVREWDAEGVANDMVLGEDDPEVRRLEDVLGTVLERAGIEALSEIGLDVEFRSDDPKTREWLHAKTIRFADEALNRYAEDVRAALEEGKAAGETYQQLAARLDEVFDGRKNNSLTVARTESVGTESYARELAYLDAGLEEAEWMSMGDEHVRDSHAAMDGEVARIGEPFSNGLLRPGDTEHGTPEDWINCRCVVNGIVPGVSRSREARLGIWRAFETRLDSSERLVQRQFRRMVERSRGLAKAALGKTA